MATHEVKVVPWRDRSQARSHDTAHWRKADPVPRDVDEDFGEEDLSASSLDQYGSVWEAILDRL